MQWGFMVARNLWMVRKFILGNEPFGLFSMPEAENKPEPTRFGVGSYL